MGVGDCAAAADSGGTAAGAAAATKGAPAPAWLPRSRAAAVALPSAPPLLPSAPPLLPLLLVASAVSCHGQGTLQSNQGIH